jgi:hypothetical protein
MERGGWPVGLQPLGGLTFLNTRSYLDGATVVPENLADLLATESGLEIVDEDTGEPIGVEVDLLHPPFRTSWYFLMVF